MVEAGVIVDLEGLCDKVSKIGVKYKGDMDILLKI